MIPDHRKLTLAEQQVRGALQKTLEEIEARGLPDVAIFDQDSWAVLFESKVQACPNLSQLERHRRTAKRRGYESAWIVVISVDRISCKLPAAIRLGLAQ